VAALATAYDYTNNVPIFYAWFCESVKLLFCQLSVLNVSECGYAVKKNVFGFTQAHFLQIK
jgi:hypothetical protein